MRPAAAPRYAVATLRFRFLLPLFAPALVALPLCAEKPVSPMAGPRATAIAPLHLQVAANDDAQRLGEVEPGRELVIVEHNGEWLRIFANTDTEKSTNPDEDPEFGQPDAVPPISGWVHNRGIITADTPAGDRLLYGEAASLELEATERHGRKSAAQQARLLYRRLAEIFPDSSLAPEAAWRAADIRWQIEKADVMSRPSAKELNGLMREQIGEAEMKAIEKRWPRTRAAALAAWDRLDNKLCGDWQGQPNCPEKETDIYERYADQYPDGPRAAEALFKAVYRQAVVADMYKADDRQKKSEAARAHAKDDAAQLLKQYGSSDFAARAAGVVYKLEQGIPVYGTGIE